MHIVRLLRSVLVGAVLVASPAYAQAPWLFTGDDDDDYFDYPPCPIELTDPSLRRAVGRQGFSDIFLNARNDQRVQVRATQGQWVYLLQVDTCTGSIIYGQRLRPA